jgi:glycosyltransferase involved in cell wall biosynthesis
MNHLHFTQSLEPLYGGGLGSSALALHKQMRDSGVNSVLCSTHGGVPQHPSENTLEFSRVQPRPLYFSPAMQKRAPNLVREAHVLHGHGLYVGTNFIFGREARRQGKPLVYHVQGMFEPYILNRSRWKKNLVHKLFEDDNINHVRLWRALTAKEADQIRACGYKAPIVVAPNGLNIREYPRPENTSIPLDTPLIKNLTKSKKRLLFLSRIHPKKGLDLLLPALARLQSLARDWEVVVAGPDEQGYLKHVQNLAASLGIEKTILFTGTVTAKTKVALLYSADLFVLPSYSEGLPVSLLEAMACEVPVVATHACNCPDIYPAGAGWGCDPTLDSVADAIKSAFMASESERGERGRKGRELVRQAYGWDKIAETLLSACQAHCC